MIKSLKNCGTDPLEAARIAKMGADVLDKIAGVDLKEAQLEELMRKVLASGHGDTIAPRGAPAHVAAVWGLFKQGDPEATRIVTLWIEGKDFGSGAAG